MTRIYPGGNDIQKSSQNKRMGTFEKGMFQKVCQFITNPNPVLFGVHSAIVVMYVKDFTLPNE